MVAVSMDVVGMAGNETLCHVSLAGVDMTRRQDVPRKLPDARFFSL